MTISNIRNASNFKQTVLLIDDQSTVLDIHAAILNSLKLNLNIVKMTDPVEALLWMANKQIDLIVSDFHMPQMNGMQLVKTVSNIKVTGPKPIIVVTVFKDKKLHQSLIDAGASACLTKPVDSDDFLKVARSLLEKSNQFYKQGLVA